jgi:hypothetical protein
MDSESESYGTLWLWPNLKYYPNICLVGQRKCMMKLRHYSESGCQDLNQGPPKYEVGVLTTHGHIYKINIQSCAIHINTPTLHTHACTHTEHI